jgi:integrase
MEPEPETQTEPQTFTWPAWAKETAPRNIKRREGLFNHFTHWMNQHAQSIWAGNGGHTLTRDEHERLRKKLGETAHGATAEIILIDWWDRLISAGNLQDRWKIGLLPPIVRLPAPRPTFVRRDFQLLQEFRVCESAFRQLLSEGIPPDKLMEAALCSAVMYGGILAPKTLAALIGIRAEDIAGDRGRLRVMLPVESSSSQVIAQRWYPDALTSVLLVRALAANLLPQASRRDNLAETKILDRLDSALDSLGLPACGNGGSDFIRGARVAQALYVSPYLCAYMAGDSASHCLSDSVLRRLNGWQSKKLGAAALEKQPDSPARGALHKSGIGFDPEKKPIDQFRAIREVNAVLTKSRDAVRQLDAYLHENRPSLWPITVLLVEWVKWLVGAHGQAKPVRCSSAMRYLGAIARHLIDVAETEPLLDMDPEDFETLYELAGERVLSVMERPVFWGRIRSFHDFLYLCGAPEIELQELDGYMGANQAGVSANLISEGDFQTFKSALLTKDSYVDLKLRQRAFLVGMLGFRCGLRRREIQMLWLRDIHPGNDPYLIVRPSRLASLKTSAAERRIPLGPLVPESELKLLLELAAHRKDALGDDPGLLFAHTHDPRVPLPAVTLFDPVTAAFQRIAGLDDPQFRFHHLRHSFANWLFLALLAADQPWLIDRDLPMFSAYLLNLEQTKNIKDAFFPKLLGTPRTPTRRNLYLVCALMGHLSPATTLKSYFHILDWLAGQECDRALAERIRTQGSRALGIICGLSASMPHKAPYRDLVDRPIEFLRRFVLLHLPKAFQEKPFKGDKAAPPADLSHVLEMIGKEPVPHPVTMMIIVDRYQGGTPIETLVRVYGIQQAAIEKAWSAYKQMYAKQSVRNKKKNIPPPRPPRPRKEQKEFWRVIDATYKAFQIASNQPAMIEAAKVLARRTGPGTGRMYPGLNPKNVLSVVDGLFCMGVGPELLQLAIRYPAVVIEERPQVDEIARTLARHGIKEVACDLNWPKRKEMGALLRLDVLLSQHENKRKKARLGRVRGLNYAAAWVLFVSALTRTKEASGS